MHYIRLLRPPAIERGKLKLALTITTDLGDAYLSPGEPVALSVIGAFHDAHNRLTPINLTQNATPRWRGGMRVLKFDLPLPPQPIKTIQIRPTGRQLAALGTSDVYPAPAGKGLIVGVYADVPSDDGGPSQVCFRSLRLVGDDPSAPVNALQVEEDFGDSIARHIWDGGVVTLSLIADICLSARSSPLPVFSDILRQTERAINVLELGCGVGIVGIGLSRILMASRAAGASTILMTDLPEAEERTQANISRLQDDVAQTGGPAHNIDYENLDWQEGRSGVFGEKARSKSWDLIVVSECTYNTDTLLALVRTLSALYAQSTGSSGSSRDTKVFLSTKPRHSSERGFFEMMAVDGWLTTEKAVLPLPVLNGDAQSVEMYLFSKGTAA
ncbi:hypothetical protein OQA88_6959 [Cercophora sp. LCS_1]